MKRLGRRSVCCGIVYLPCGFADGNHSSHSRFTLIRIQVHPSSTRRMNQEGA